MPFGEKLVVRTKWIPPRLKPPFLARPRISQSLKQAFQVPITILKADPGYGKSSALARFLSESAYPGFWYSLSETDSDPLLFLLHLIYLFRTRHPICGNESLALLQSQGGATQLWAPAVDALVNDLLDALHEETLLVLDDYHAVDRPEINYIVDRFLEQMPPRLHVILATRTMPSLPSRIHWRVHGELLEITQMELAFAPTEVSALFEEHYAYPLPLPQAEALTAETEGWIIALHMVGQQLHATTGQTVDGLIGALPGSLGLLFEYLTAEVFAKQSPELQTFMLQTSALRRLNPQVCDTLLERSDSAEQLRYLDEHSLFVVGLGSGAYRYHNLFHDFLAQRARAHAEEWRTLHHRAAEIYRNHGDGEEAVYHFLAAGENDAAARLLDEIGRAMVQAGRWEALAGWIDQIPKARVQACDDLLFYRAEALRLSSRFEDALTFYEDSRHQAAAKQDSERELNALFGQAMVYLDTVQPARATPILARAHLMLREHPLLKGKYLALVAENLTNAGCPRKAERLHGAIHRLDPGLGLAEMDPRIYVREGRLSDARAMVQEDLQGDPWSDGKRRTPRSHRESTLLLSWICAMMGDADEARANADRGLRLARELHSPIMEALALARLGHAYLTGSDYDPVRALASYEESLRLSDAIHVARFGAEARLGMTAALGLKGQWEASEEQSRLGLEILQTAGDAYLSSVVELALGGAAVMANDERAGQWLRHAEVTGMECGDTYGPCLARIWQALWHLERREWTEFDSAAGGALQLAREQNYGFLFTRQTFVGPKEPYGIAALLTAANRRGLEAAFAAQLLQELAMKLPSLAPSFLFFPHSHSGAGTPDPALYLQTLGPFRVWRGEREIAKNDWGREKALQLFHLLLARRAQAPLHREQIAEILYPDAKPSTAAASLRVALNALRQALEPERSAESEGQFVQRQGDLILLNPESNLHLDVDEFERTINQARQAETRDLAQALPLYRRALSLYRGDFLQDALYEDWAREERDHLVDLYLTTASHTAELLARQGVYDEAIHLCRQVLAKDACWEEAYYLLMLCYSQTGNRSLALRTYSRCAKHLRADLGVEPATRTTALFEQIARL